MKNLVKTISKYSAILLFVYLPVNLSAQSQDPNQSQAKINSQNKKNKIEGVWRLMKSNNGNSLTNTKIITKDSFIWYGLSPENDIITGAGGIYTLNGNEYTEYIRYTYNGMKNFKGEKTTFTIEIKDNKLVCTGVFDKSVLVEVWERIE